MDLYSMIEARGHVKPELTGEALVRFAVHLIETAQETRAGEPARQPVEEVLQTNGETVEKCHARITTLQAWAKAGYPVPVKTDRKNFSPCPRFRISSMTVETRGENNSYNNSRNGNGRHTPVLASPAVWQDSFTRYMRNIGVKRQS